MSEYPSKEYVARVASELVLEVMGKGSDKSGQGEWFTRDSLRLVSDRVHTHLATALMMHDGNKPDPDPQGEDMRDHAARAVVRAVMVYLKLENSHKEAQKAQKALGMKP